MILLDSDERPVRARRPARLKEPAWPWVLAAIVWLVVLLVLGPRALDIEAANEQRAREVHIQATDR